LLELQARSSSRVQTWGNTLEAQREQALLARARRLELAEKREQELETQEQAIRDAERRAIVERAQQIQFVATDSVKKLTNAALLGDVLLSRQFSQKVNF
jgi:hypothetical protein